MSTCQRCGVSAWHPEVRSCTATDCELRARDSAVKTDAGFHPLGSASLQSIDDVSEPGSWARAIARGCAPSASNFVEQDAGDCQPQALGREVQGVRVHEERSAA